jgi:hypothetical protein
LTGPPLRPILVGVESGNGILDLAVAGELAALPASGDGVSAGQARR